MLTVPFCAAAPPSPPPPERRKGRALAEDAPAGAAAELEEDEGDGGEGGVGARQDEAEDVLIEAAAADWSQRDLLGVV